MARSTDAREPRDLSYIGVDEAWEVEWWAVRFDVSPDELREAVRQHGNDAKVMEQRLKDAARKSLRNMGED